MDRIQVKVCGITTPAQAEIVLAAGADYVGVNCYPKSPRFVPPAKLDEVLAAIPGGKRVFVDVETGTELLEGWGDRGFDHFQIHHSLDVSLATIASWSGTVGAENLWLAPKMKADDDFPQAALHFAETIVLDAVRKQPATTPPGSPEPWGGTGKTGDWTVFSTWQTLYQHKRFLLAGGLNPDNVTTALEQSGALFVDVNSGVESAPGTKDAALVRDFFAAVHAFQNTLPDSYS